MDSRLSAIEILNQLDSSNKTLDILLDHAHKEKKFTYKKDRALLQALVFGVLRHRLRLDWIIRHYSNIPIEKINPIVLNILRIGLFQIIYLDRIPVSASVNTSVDLTKMFAPVWTAKFVNAVLRNAATSFESVPFPDPEKDVIESISVEKSFPRWLIHRWFERFGKNDTEKLCDTINSIAPITVRTNALRTTRDKLHKSLESEVGEIWHTPFSADGISFLNPRMMISELTAFKLGWFQVQDEAAQLVTGLLEPCPGETILDACAGLGGKTGHIAQLMKNHGNLVAMDVEKGKISRLAEDMNRQFISIAKTHIHDLNEPLRGKPYLVYDRIFLDAPCSGIGVLRRNPDAKWRSKPEELEAYGKRQNLFLNHLAPAVKPGGILVYGVCSFEPEETDMVIKTFLLEHPEFIIDTPPQKMIELNPSFFSSEGYFRSFPHKHGMDGFFAVRLLKIK